jgi:hypothetical protein
MSGCVRGLENDVGGEETRLSWYLKRWVDSDQPIKQSTSLQAPERLNIFEYSIRKSMTTNLVTTDILKTFTLKKKSHIGEIPL